MPIALGACAVLYLASLPFSGDYSQAKALMIVAPLAMLVIDPPPAHRVRLDAAETRPDRAFPAHRSAAGCGVGWAVARGRLRRRRGLLELPGRCGTRRSGRPGTGRSCEAFLPIVHGKPVLYAGQDRYAAYELLGADTHVPLVEFPDAEVSPNPEKPFDTGDAYSPIDFDSFNRGTLDRFPYVITSRAAWNSQAPPNFKRIAKTADYVLWERTGPTPRSRHVLLEGTEAGALRRLQLARDPRSCSRTGGKRLALPAKP